MPRPIGNLSTTQVAALTTTEVAAADGDARSAR